jgi:hypothetical protein
MKGYLIMAVGLPNKPKILKGVFVEYGFSLLSLLVIFKSRAVVTQA